MTALLIGYARVSTDAQDFTAQREGLLALGADPGRLYVDHGLTGTNRERPGLREALATCREGDTLVPLGGSRHLALHIGKSRLHPRLGRPNGVPESDTVRGQLAR